MRHLFLLWIFSSFLSGIFAQNSDFAVEVGAFAEKVPLSYFKIAGVYETYDQNQIYRYYIDAKNRPEAEILRQQAITAGHKNARVIDFDYIREQCEIACSYVPPKRTSDKTSSGTIPQNKTTVSTPEKTTPTDIAKTPSKTETTSKAEPLSKGIKTTDADLYVFWGKELRKKGIPFDSASLYAFWKKEQKRIGLDSAAWMRLWERELERSTVNPIQPAGIDFGLTTDERVRSIFFDYNSYALRDASKQELEKLEKIMRDHRDWQVEIGAHTDSRGGSGYNQRLSMKRANSARKYLIYKGIGSSRIRMKYYGKEQPIARNEFADGSDCPDGRQLNRRVEFTVFNEKGERMDIVLRIDVPENLRY